jgi:5'-nucleotidase
MLVSRLAPAAGTIQACCMERPFILLTNDDGIGSPFLAALARALLPRAELAVAAPKSEQSWIGKAVSRRRRVAAQRRDELHGCPCWEIDGTPSDCVNIALGHLLPRQPDLVVSGLNIGLNAGLPFILASGTVAGALEGAFHGLPAVAGSFELTSEQFEAVRSLHGRPPPELESPLAAAAERAAELAVGWATRDPHGRVLVHNLNFPNQCAANTPVRRTVPARLYLGALFAPDDSEPDSFSFKFSLGGELPSPGLTDRETIERGEISHSILDFGQLGVIPTPVQP